MLRRTIAAAARITLLLPALAPLGIAHAQQQDPPIVPPAVRPAPVVRTAVDDALLTEAERHELRIRHGLLDEVPEELRDTAGYALAAFDLDHPALFADDAPALLRAEAAYHRGDLHMVPELLAGDESPRARLLVGRALVGMGRYDRAAAVLGPLRQRAQNGELQTAADLTAAAEAIAELAALEGSPAADYHFIMDLLARAQQQVDRLYWPALLAQGRLLVEKDNPQEAVNALHGALRLNPTASEAWYLLGRVALNAFDFDQAMTAVYKLRMIQPDHVLAQALRAEIYLTQKDTRSVEHVLAEALMRWPNHRRLLACAAAAAALSYDEQRTEAALRRFESVAGANPLALYLSGKYLSFARQYDAAERTLKTAAARQPNWPQPLIELGLLLSQAGKEDEALAVLRHVADLDPFNKRAANTLKLHEQLAGYRFIETEHFIIKYRDEIDGALAADMPPVLERIYREVTAAFDHEPRRKTLIEVLPDKRWFAVRITGMPWIWTIGAATGPVIAITPPREGSHHAGVFDWPRVIRHEFTHTVTLDRTANRIPHWFTEACAVAQEPAPRDYDTCRLLAKALENGDLFDLDEINWAFVRPRQPHHRALAYAQAHWMYEYITERFGHRTILQMLELSRRGAPQAELVPRAVGRSASEFLADFRQWAHRQVRDWGLAPTPGAEELLGKVREAGPEGAADMLDELLATYPSHPDLLRLAAERALRREDAPEAAYALLLRYAEQRPVDPWADRRMAELALRLDRPAEAIPHLERLDRFDQHSGDHAERLMRLYRRLGRLDSALHAASRALARRPYDAALREAAAAIALQGGDDEAALRHVHALTLIEPDRSIHFVRLAALYHRMGRTDEAREAALKARQLDADAPVDAFVND